MQYLRNVDISARLHFIEGDHDEAVDVLCDIKYGDFDQRVWKATVGFSDGYSLPEDARRLLFHALLSETVETVLELRNGERHPCWITSIDDLADEAAVDIASPVPALHERLRLTLRGK